MSSKILNLFFYFPHNRCEWGPWIAGTDGTERGSGQHWNGGKYRSNRYYRKHRCNWRYRQYRIIGRYWVYWFKRRSRCRISRQHWSNWIPRRDRKNRVSRHNWGFRLDFGFIEYTLKIVVSCAFILSFLYNVGYTN